MAKTFTQDELKQLNKRENLHLLIHGKVYSLAKFVDEHPGGDEVLYGEAGRDATEAFEDVGHSDEAREILDKHYAGEGPADMAKGPDSAQKAKVVGGARKQSSTTTYLLPLAILAAWIAYRYYDAKE